MPPIELPAPVDEDCPDDETPAPDPGTDTPTDPGTPSEPAPAPTTPDKPAPAPETPATPDAPESPPAVTPADLEPAAHTVVEDKGKAQLAHTGANASTTAGFGIAAGLVIAGAGAMVYARRRSS